MSNSEYHEEELLKRKEKQEAKENNLIKGQKLLTLSSRIAEHDLMTMIKKIGKLLEKHYEVKVVISGEESETNSHYVNIFITAHSSCNVYMSASLLKIDEKFF